MSKPKIRFIDLFAGLGGFHAAINRVRICKTECVFSSELDDGLRKIYAQNFQQECAGDITLIDERDIPKHDLLCAGFPCQPFSKAGNQRGLDCPSNGGLFPDHILRIIKHHKPDFLLLENVPNLKGHDSGRTWIKMEQMLRADGLAYDIAAKVLSPASFGVPQIRKRLYIVASRRKSGLADFQWPEANGVQPSIESIIEAKPEKPKPLPEHYERAIEVWNEFLKKYPKQKELVSPIWGMEFGATYPFERRSPSQSSVHHLRSCRGPLGCTLVGRNLEEILGQLPSYARTPTFPLWKQRFIRQSREVYEDNKSWMRGWKKNLVSLSPSLQKLEWNCMGETRDIWKHLVQFRGSGIRVKRTTAAPTLVTMTTQIPVIGSQRRFMTLQECARLQGLDRLKALPQNEARAIKALGNAVNTTVVQKVASNLLATRSSNRTNRRDLDKQLLFD